MTSLTELKIGYRLNVLVALAVLIAPARVEQIMDQTGCSRDTIKDTLRWMSTPEQGLVLSVPNGRWPTWALTAAGAKFLRDILQALQAGESYVAMMPIFSASEIDTPPSPAEKVMPIFSASNAHKVEPVQKLIGSSMNSDAEKIGIRSPLTTTTNIYKESDSHTVVVGELTQNVVVALRAAHVWPNLCQRLADELVAEDGPRWLRQILGWIAIEHGEDGRTRGSTIHEALKARMPVPDESFLPPPGMPFREALAWAERGGHAAPAPEPAPELFDDADAEPAPAAAPLTDAEKLWRAVLAELAREISKATFGTHVAGTRLLRIEPGPECDVYVIGVASPQARDWIAKMLHAKLIRVLAALAPRPCELAFEVEAQEEPHAARS